MVTFKSAPDLRPRPCVGSLLDIPFGSYHTGKYGDSILNGGFANFTGIVARGNMYKTTLALSICLRVFDRYCKDDENAGFDLYDTELTASWARMEQLGQYLSDDFSMDTYRDRGQLILTTHEEYFGNQWWATVVEQAKERAKAAKSIRRKTPFLDRKGGDIEMIPPFIHMIDSLSQFRTESIDKIFDENEIGDATTTTAPMRDGGVKTQLINQAPNVSTGSGIYLLMTAHLGDQIKTDPYQPSIQKLQYVKKGQTFKNVPEKFTFLTSACWVITDAQPLIRQQDKTLEYPRKNQKAFTNDPDLQILTLVNVRSKFGPTGHVFKLIVSQQEGLLPSLSEFHHLKSRKDKFGLLGPEGIHKDWRLALYPDVLIKRTQIRDLIDEDPRLRRALEITAELCQIYEYWNNIPEEEKIEPSELKAGIEKKGYDWNRLLDTRGYWTFDHYENPVPPLSTMDLLNIYHDRYKPFWYDQKDSSSKKGSKK